MSLENSREEMVSFLNLCKDFLKESRYSKEVLGEEKCFHIVQRALQNPDYCFVRYKQDKDGKVIGLFLGYLEYLFFNETVQARDLVFYVHPDHRGTSWFPKTLKEFEQWAKDKGAVYMEILHNTGINTDKALPMYERLGYQHVGYVFNKEL